MTEMAETTPKNESKRKSKSMPPPLEANVVQDNFPVKVIPKLFIGSKFSGYNYDALRDLGITHILNASSNPSSFPAMFTYLSLNIRDSEDANILSCVPASNIFIKAGIESGGCLVHCHYGRSRSSALVAAYLMSTYNQSYEKSIEQIRHIRAVAAPNAGFELQLRAYEESDYDTYSAQVNALIRGNLNPAKHRLSTSSRRRRSERLESDIDTITISSDTPGPSEFSSPNSRPNSERFSGRFSMGDLMVGDDPAEDTNDGGRYCFPTLLDHDSSGGGGSISKCWLRTPSPLVIDVKSNLMPPPLCRPPLPPLTLSIPSLRLQTQDDEPYPKPDVISITTSLSNATTASASTGSLNLANIAPKLPVTKINYILKNDKEKDEELLKRLEDICRGQNLPSSLILPDGSALHPDIVLTLTIGDEGDTSETSSNADEINNNSSNNNNNNNEAASGASSRRVRSIRSNSCSNISSRRNSYKRSNSGISQMRSGDSWGSDLGYNPDDLEVKTEGSETSEHENECCFFENSSEQFMGQSKVQEILNGGSSSPRISSF